MLLPAHITKDSFRAANRLPSKAAKFRAERLNLKQRTGDLQPAHGFLYFVSHRVEWRRGIPGAGAAILLLVHLYLSKIGNRSNSALGIKMCRSARFGLISPRLIKRRTVMVETPPRYCAASFIFSAPSDA